MPAAAAAGFDIAVFAVVILLLLLAYMLYTLGDLSPTFWPIGDSIKNLFYGVGDVIAGWAGDVADIAKNGTGLAIRTSIKLAHTLGYGISGAVSYIGTIFWNIQSDVFNNAVTDEVLGVVGGSLLYLGGRTTALEGEVADIYSRISGISIPVPFNPADILNRLGWIENHVLPILESQMSAVQHDISTIFPRLDSIARSGTNTATYVATAVPSALHRISVLEGIIGSIPTDINSLRGELRKFESTIAGQITALGADEAKINQWITANSDLLTKLAILTAISALGAVGVQTLIQNAMNPCKCLSLGGDYEWLIPLVMYNTAESL